MKGCSAPSSSFSEASWLEERRHVVKKDRGNGEKGKGSEKKVASPCLGAANRESNDEERKEKRWWRTFAKGKKDELI